MNWIRNSHFHQVGPTYPAAFIAGAGGWLAPQWWHGPGAGGSTSVNMNEAVQGDWAGNPERFPRIQWTSPPQSGDAPYAPNFRFTFLEQWINSARILCGKQVTFSGQIRGSVGMPIIPIIWRSFGGPTFTRFDGAQFTVTAGITRFDFTCTLPPIPAGQSVNPASSYVGIGLDLNGQFAPTLDIGPMRLNEGGPQDFDEVPGYEERFWCGQL